ncbi:SigE family RNA polymerase sigma factor [Spirilliplanes yamanashiensis]|nr:SigE family RNA polymerase sigma factor [Spirilliplanes yamanashiensis]MDP9816388.1 RNA polymerase sigma-70 factor (sigma-E family) [Spirilliplanes yamanashiensis]
MSGDDFTAFVAHSGPRLLRYAVLLCGDRGEAEDLLQETLIRVYPRWHRLREQQPEAYVRRALTNRAVSRWRSPWHRRRVDGVPERPVPGDELGRADDRQVLLAALRSLPDRMRAVVVLRYWLGCTEQEAAAELGCSVGSVKSQASRGLARLRATVGTATAQEAGR